tara:strand:- start:1358 stop:1825 length:468 start_codon:yes stop_codon:yes gene_type:complete
MKFEYTKDLIVKLMKHECDINYEVAEQWIKYLENKKTEDVSGSFARKYTSIEIKKILEKSVMAHEDHYMEWIEGQFDNDLPNTSSGSTLTALLDIDNLFAAFDNAIEEIDNNFGMSGKYNFVTGSSTEGDIANEIYSSICKYDRSKNIKYPKEQA